MKRLGTLLVAAPAAAACGCSSKICLSPYNLCAHVGGSIEIDCSCTTC